jgi:hypothetical protein
MKISERIARLIDVKSLVTLALVIVLCVMTVLQMETSELFNSAVMLVLGFFFGKNLKSSGEGGADEAAGTAAPEQAAADPADE